MRLSAKTIIIIVFALNTGWIINADPCYVRVSSLVHRNVYSGSTPQSDGLKIGLIPSSPYQRDFLVADSRTINAVVLAGVGNVGYLSSQSSQTAKVSCIDYEQRKRLARLLDDALLTNTTAASVLLDELNELRRSSSKVGEEDSQRKVEEYLNEILSMVNLENIDHEKKKMLPWWTTIRFLSRVSQRARRASLRRVLIMSTPAAEGGKEEEGYELENLQRRRRRSLTVLLRSLASSSSSSLDNDNNKATIRTSRMSMPAIRELERAARREFQSGASADDIASRLPEGLETPRYEVLVRRPAKVGGGGYEVRRYEPFSVCAVDMNRPRPSGDKASATDAKLQNPQLAGASSFGALAGYLFGKNDRNEAMKMTTPVLSTLDGQGKGREMAFVMPSVFWAEGGVESAPQPLPQSGVKLSVEGGGVRAVLLFGGLASKKDVAARTDELLKGLVRDRDWMAVTDAPISLAQYNDPFTPPWKRRNEVSVAVIPRESGDS